MLPGNQSPLGVLSLINKRFNNKLKRNLKSNLLEFSRKTPGIQALNLRSFPDDANGERAIRFELGWHGGQPLGEQASTHVVGRGA